MPCNATLVPSVRLWKLPSWVEPRRALAALKKTIDDAGIGGAINARVRELRHAEREPVELPGFHVFSRGGTAAPYTWLVPKPKGDYVDLMNLWETYVGQPLGGRGTAEDPLAVIRGDSSVMSRVAFNRYFGPARATGAWASPAAKMIAIAQHFEGQENLSFEITGPTHAVERQRLQSVDLHLAECLLRVTPKGVYSNFARGEVNPKYLASDASMDELCIRSIRTAHPLAVALVEHEETPETALFAASVCIRALTLGRLRARELSISTSRTKADDTGLLVRQALAMLDEPPADPLSAMYEILVPGAFTKTVFVDQFGHPFRDSKPRPSTIRNWQSVLSGLIP